MEIYDSFDIRNYSNSNQQNSLETFLSSESESDVDIINAKKLTMGYDYSLYSIKYSTRGSETSDKIKFNRSVKPTHLFKAESADDTLIAKFYPNINILYLSSHDYYLTFHELASKHNLSKYKFDWLCSQEFFEENIEPILSG